MSAVLAFTPRVGGRYRGGTYAGRCADHQVIVGKLMVAPATASWADASSWAQGLTIDGYADYSLPAIDELLLLEATCLRHMRGGLPWWSCQAHPISHADAMVVLDGGVFHWGTHHACRAVAIRREVLASTESVDSVVKSVGRDGKVLP